MRHILDLGYVLAAINFDLTDPDEYLDTDDPRIVKKANNEHEKALNFYSENLILALGNSI